MFIFTLEPSLFILIMLFIYLVSQQTILVPLGAIPMYQLQGAFSGTTPIVLIPSLINSQKVNAPIPIAPKPAHLGGVNSQPCVTNLSKLGSTPTTTDAASQSKNASGELLNISDGSILKKNMLNPIVPNDVNTKQAKDQTTANCQGEYTKLLETNVSASSSLTFLSSNSDSNLKIVSGSSSDGKLSSTALCSAGSNLSDLTINSSELQSSQTMSSEEIGVIASIKELNEEEKRIVNIIKELEESTENMKNKKESKQAESTYSSSLSRQPQITLPSMHTDNWSIVKSMLVNTIKAKQLKVSQQELIDQKTTVETNTTTSCTGPIVNTLQHNDPKKSETIDLLSPITEHTEQEFVSFKDFNPSSGELDDLLLDERATPMFVEVKNEELNSCDILTDQLNLSNTLAIQSNSNSNLSMLITPKSEQNMNLESDLASSEFKNNLTEYKIEYKDPTNDKGLILSDNELVDRKLLSGNQPVNKNRSELTVNTTATVDDLFLTTFVSTPKTPRSGAAGYGLGMDFEDLFAGSSIDL